MKILKFASLFIAISSIFACNDEFEIPSFDAEQLVVCGYVTPDSTFVYLKVSDGIENYYRMYEDNGTSELNNLTFYFGKNVRTDADAKVVLYENDIVFDTLKFVEREYGNSFFLSKKSVSDAKKYTIKVVDRDYGIATASTIMPKKSNIENVYHNFTKQVNSGYWFDLDIIGNVGFSVNVSENQYFYFPEIQHASKVNNEGVAVFICENRIISSYSGGLYSVVGGNKIDVVYNCVTRINSLECDKNLFTKCRFYSLSEDLYCYLIKKFDYKNALDTYSEPIFPYFNVEGGVGIFGAYNYFDVDVDFSNLNGEAL